MQLWVVMEKKIVAVAVTEINIHPKAKHCRIIIIAGDGMNQWFDELILTIKNWAIQNQCNRIEGVGRKGWIKQSKHLGFKESYSVVILEL